MQNRSQLASPTSRLGKGLPSRELGLLQRSLGFLLGCWKAGLEFNLQAEGTCYLLIPGLTTLIAVGVSHTRPVGETISGVLPAISRY